MNENLAEKLAGGLGNGTKVRPIKRQEKAKAEKPANKTAKAGKPRVRKPKPPTPEPAKPASLLEEIFLAGDALSGVDVMGGIAVANSILTNSRAVAIFVKALSEADALAIQKLGFDRLEADVKEEWYALSLAEIETQLRDWVREGSDAPGKMLAVLAAIGGTAKTVDAIDPLWRLYVEIVRPARDVQTYYELSQLLKNLNSKGLTETFLDRTNLPADAVTLRGRGWHTTRYLPAMERGKKIPMAEAGWPFIKEAEARAQKWAEERRGRLAELKGSATKDFTPAKAKAGNEGTIFLQTGPNSGALLQVEKNKVRIAQVVGTMARRTGWMSWDSEQEPWLDENLFNAFQAWKEKKEPT